MKIGYVPYNEDLSHPDDRRRFPFFAERHGVKYEIADVAKEYDVVLLPAPANLTRWLNYKKRNPGTKFIFEMVDSLIYQDDWFNTLFKGVGRYWVGKEDNPCLNHRNLLVRWLKIADIVICSNPIVKKEISKWNHNVMLSLDYLEHEYPLVKDDYSVKGKMKLFWEGQGVVLPQLLAFKDVFREVSSFCELHVVTSESYPRYGQFMNRSTRSLLKELPVETHFHQWDLHRNAELFKNFDCGIIPINKRDQYGWHKPANKLISFWFSGIPTLASGTPAYLHVAEKTDNDFICTAPEDWIYKIRQMKAFSPAERKRIAQTQYDAARKLFSNSVHDQFWIELFSKISKRFSDEVAVETDPAFEIAV